MFNRDWVENRPTSDFPLPGWISSQVVACHVSFVIFTDIIQTVLETSEFFLSDTNNNMHILATGTEEQAVYSGHLWTPVKLLITAPAAIRSSWFIEQALETVLKPFTMKICEVIWIFMNYL